MAKEFKINLTDKPNLSKAFEENPKLASEVVKTFVDLAEEAFDPDKGIRWADLPKELHKDLSFTELVKGVLRGVLDVKAINPDGFDAMKVEIHPLAMLSPRKNYLDDKDKVYHWRNHWSFPSDIQINGQTIASILRRILRYNRYIRIEDLAKAIETNQLVTFRGLGERNVELLPFYPALRYQKANFGDLRVGKFLDDYGWLDCGPIDEGMTECPACKHETLKDTKTHKLCLTCNGGFVK